MHYVATLLVTGERGEVLQLEIKLQLPILVLFALVNDKY